MESNKKVILYDSDGNPISREPTTLVKSRRKLKAKTIGKIVSGFLAMFGVAWGLYTYFVPISHPDLYVTLQPTDETEWAYEREAQQLIDPVEDFTFSVSDPDSFYQATLVPPPDEGFYGRVAAKFYVLNKGSRSASAIWLNIYLPPELPMRVIGSDEWNTGYESGSDRNVAYYQMAQGTMVGASSVVPTYGILALDVPLIPKVYEFKYTIGGAGLPSKERTLRMKVTSDEVSPAYLENAKGLEYAKTDEYEAALDSFKKAIAMQSETAAFHFNAGTMLMELNQPKQAERYFRKATTISPEIGEIWGNLGVSLLTQRKFVEALDAIDHALKINPSSEIDIDNHTYVLRMLGKHPNGSRY
jgi:tetratricopeptide (TPR) repeat protein